MSIFPKRVTKNENVIIHMKFTISSNRVCYCLYSTKVISPSGKEIVSWKNGFYMMSHWAVSEEKEIYHCVEHTMLEEPGKYLVKTDLYLEGKVINSETEMNDYFYYDNIIVDNICYKDADIMFELRNPADNTVPVKLIESDKNCSEITILPHDKMSFRCKKGVVIKYISNSILLIEENNARYIRNEKYSWRKKGSDIELFDNNSFSVITLPNIVAFLWLNCNGVNNLDALENLLDVERTTLTKLISYLESEKFIYRAK